MAVLGQDVLDDIRGAEASSYEPVPSGEYTVQVEATELKPTKSGTGTYIKAELTILGPAYQGRKLWHNFNIINANAEAQRIGKQQVKSLMLAGGMTQEQIDQFNDTDQLIGLTCNAIVDVQEARGGYDAQNRIKRFKRAAAGFPATAGVPATAGFPAAAGVPFAGPAGAGAPAFAPQAPAPAPADQSWFR